MKKRKSPRPLLVDQGRLNRIIDTLPPDWRQQGMEPPRGLFTPQSNISTKAVAAAISAMLIAHATGEPIEKVGLEQSIVFGLTLNKAGTTCLAYDRAVDILMEGTPSQIVDAFTPGTKFGVYEFARLKEVAHKADKKMNSGREKLKTADLLKERRLALEFVDLISMEALSRAYKYAASEFSTDRPGQGDAEKATQLNILWAELKTFKK